jgi:TetR/AcrR family transcriptional regulator, lmrAB and yxaGH operons repressor
MIGTAAELFRRQGYDATSWRQITSDSGAPAGSIGFLFPEGKEQLATEVVALVGTTTRQQIGALLASEPDPARATQRWIRASAQILIDSDFTDGCPIATLALELAHRSEPVQGQLAASYEGWIDAIADHLAPSHGDKARPTAEVLLSAFEGALLLARARHSSVPLETLADCVPAILAALVEPDTRRSPNPSRPRRPAGVSPSDGEA